MDRVPLPDPVRFRYAALSRATMPAWPPQSEKGTVGPPHRPAKPQTLRVPVSAFERERRTREGETFLAPGHDRLQTTARFYEHPDPYPAALRLSNDCIGSAQAVPERPFRASHRDGRLDRSVYWWNAGAGFPRQVLWASRKVKPLRFTPSGMLRGREVAGPQKGTAGSCSQGDHKPLRNIDAMEIVNALDGIAFVFPSAGVVTTPTAGGRVPF